MIAMLGHGGPPRRWWCRPRLRLPLPEGRSFEDGSALILTYATSIHALLDRGRLEAGQTLLVLGAAGGVGLAAVELGKAFDARVIGAVSSKRRPKAVRAAGADKVIVYPRGPFDKDASKALASQFKEAVGGQGADLIYDPVGGDYAEPALAQHRLGRALSGGRLPGRHPEAAAQPHLLKSCDVCGVFWGAFAARTRSQCRPHPHPVSLWDEGKIAPKVSRIWPLEQGGEAIAHMAARKAVGKLVVAMDG
jgi:NADPH:quinone reductase-like Zn-dependent oxidoreductase